MRFDWIAGTGGIGKGEVFRLIGNETLGREESRSAVLTDYKDYCKAHIILSYPARLLPKKVPVFALGKVGDDDRGNALIGEMEAVGIQTRFLEKSKLPTKYSVCYLYENGNGGNITTCNDACGEVDAAYLLRTLNEIVSFYGGNGLVLAAPEVELKERMEFLSCAKKNGAMTVASVLAGEAEEFLDKGYARYCDVLAVNADEIKALGNGDGERGVRAITEQNKSAALIVTAGEKGAICRYGGKIKKIPALKANVVSTAGAGDALLGGMMAGLCGGLEIQEAVRLGAACASFAVESPHTIPEKLNGDAVKRRYIK